MLERDGGTVFGGREEGGRERGVADVRAAHVGKRARERDVIDAGGDRRGVGRGAALP
jgi:hypothetical protein